MKHFEERTERMKVKTGTDNRFLCIFSIKFRTDGVARESLINGEFFSLESQVMFLTLLVKPFARYVKFVFRF